VKRNFFSAHKRVLIKIIPHHNESVYRLELSHFHLSLAAICTAIVLLAILIDHIVVVRTAQAQVKQLQTVNLTERAQLAKFSKQTSVIMQRLRLLQKESREIKKFTAEVQRKRVDPPHSRPVGALKKPAPDVVAKTDVNDIVRGDVLGEAPSLWQKFMTWVSTRRDGGASFASEATQLSLLGVEMNRALAESSALKAQAEAAAEIVRARELAHQRYLDEIPSIWPTAGYVSSGFGYRSYPDNGFHPGLDIVNDYGATVYATGSGIVTESGWDDGGYGYVVKIDHGNGFETMYAHNSRVLVSGGQYVRKGQAIALLGSTGFATGPHVHYGLFRYGQPIDPTPYLDGVPSELAKTDPY
jgi:murein DD-endopeptidase MepM/ murein hydrolase activator NlpD